ncbi:MAG: hypothetical protein GY811_05455 [Myxococcales bacterium]|nr:hypothetical protein [Myxococcales bacterium]
MTRLVVAQRRRRGRLRENSAQPPNSKTLVKRHHWLLRRLACAKVCVLEFFDIVAAIIYALFVLLALAMAWLDRANTKLIPPCLLLLAFGFAPIPRWLVVLLPFLVSIILLSFRKREKSEPFDYARHLLALRDNGTLSQAKYEQEKARLAAHR